MPFACIEREMMEEAGAAIVSFEVLGSIHFRTTAPNRYRPHLPHPEWYMLVGYGDVEVVGPPLNPRDGEEITSVDARAPEDALVIYEAHDPWDAALIRFAIEARRARMLDA